MIRERRDKPSSALVDRCHPAERLTFEAEEDSECDQIGDDPAVWWEETWTKPE